MKKIPDNSRPNIKYPTKWTYSVIGMDRAQLEQAIKDVVEDRSHTVSLSNVSSKGRYVSLVLQLIVLNEGERLRLFKALRDHPAVTMVL